MNRIYKNLILIALVGLLTIPIHLFAGNKDRSGQAGAQHLLIDPWAKTNGWGTAGVAEITGIESMYSNIAGMAFVNKTEFGFSRGQYLTGSNAGIGINSFALAQALRPTNKETGEKRDFGVLGVSVFTMGFGDIEITKENQPEGNMGTFSPTLTYIGIHYAKSFNSFIHGGFTGKIISESISDLRASGFALDLGVQYLSGPYENFKIGVTLKNIGLPMRYSGDGISKRAFITGTDHEITVLQRSADMEMPALLTIGLSYDFLFFGKAYKNASKDEKLADALTRKDAEHRLTLAGSFTANSYSRDLFSLGIEYGLMNIFMLRAGCIIEGQIWNAEEATTFYSGPSAGATVAIPLAKKKGGTQQILLDYAYRFTKQWKGNHYIGIKVAL